MLAIGLVPLGALAVAPGQLRCEYLQDPLGIDTAQPHPEAGAGCG